MEILGFMDSLYFVLIGCGVAISLSSWSNLLLSKAYDLVAKREKYSGLGMVVGVAGLVSSLALVVFSVFTAFTEISDEEYFLLSGKINSSPSANILLHAKTYYDDGEVNGWEYQNIMDLSCCDTGDVMGFEGEKKFKNALGDLYENKGEE